jgi:NAD(P)-dependent dehydrogenase (short-subunit alcohol dehydrogenase family)
VFELSTPAYGHLSTGFFITDAESILMNLNSVPITFAGFSPHYELQSLDADIAIIGIPYESPYPGKKSYSSQNATATIRQESLRYEKTGYFLCAREAVRRMSTKHGGHGGSIVNVSSAASRLGSAGEYVDYAASKGAIDTLTIGLAQEVAAEGIRVNAVRPAFIYTDIHASGGEPNRVDRIKEFIPMKRGGQAEEVANAIIWLLSDEASYATGTFIELSGGK